jgi:hypothetical protein
VITVAGPVQRFSTERCREMLKSLQASARKLSFLLGDRREFYAVEQGDWPRLGSILQT